MSATTRRQVHNLVDRSIRYTVPPTIRKFWMSDAFGRFLLGPVGSGKTTGVMFEIVRRAAQQRPSTRDGVRRTRFAVVRNTLSQLKQTVLRDVESWFGDRVRWNESNSILTMAFGDIHSEWFFIPLSEPEDKRRLLSMQLTGIWINEFIEIDPSLLADMGARCGRFPSPEDGGCTWSGIVADSNMPNIGSPWHKLLELERPKDYAVFIQPGGLDEDAENLDFLAQTPESLVHPVGHPARREQGRAYYHRMAEGRPPGWVKRYVHAQYGDDPEGTAVFKDTFDLKTHVVTRDRAETERRLGRSLTAEEAATLAEHGATRPIPDRPLFVAQDFGRNPCSLLWQLGPRGNMVVLDELIAEGCALESHIEAALIPKLMENRYAGMRVLVVGDPSGMAGGTTIEASCFDILQRHGLAAQPAPTNQLLPRLRAVERLLIARPEVGGIVIDGDRCPTLVRALNGFYRYGRLKDGTPKLLPEKTHPWSDIADCLQYAALCATGSFQAVAERALVRHGARRGSDRFGVWNANWNAGRTGWATPQPPRISAKAWT